MDYQSRILEIGNGKKPSKKVAELVDDYESMLVAIGDLEESIDNASDEDDTDEMESDLQELYGQRERLQQQLDKALTGWEKGIVRMENMHQKMKSNAQSQAAQGVVVAKPNPVIQKTNTQSAVVTTDNEKKGGYGWLIFGGIALILTMGAVNTFNRE